jgi:hypothetical protein
MKTIKIFGERNTGTIYLEWLLTNNLAVNLSTTPDLGWKHRLAPGQDELTEPHSSETIFLCLVKNPYSWLLSMHKKPYLHEELRKLSFSEFLNYSYGDYRNPIVMWNKKNQSYLDLQNVVKKHKLIRYEDLIDDYKKIMVDICGSFEIENPVFFKNMHNLISNSRGVTGTKFHTDFYRKERWRNALRTNHIDQINTYIDPSLMRTFNYELL